MSRGLGAIVHRLFDQNGATPAAEAETTAGMSLLARLDTIEQQLQALNRSVEQWRLAGAEEHTRAASAPDEGVAAALAALERQITRAGREQLKVNTLIEAQREQLAAALEALQVHEARREEEMAARRRDAVAAQSGARLEVAKALLPAIDGLDEALRSGRQVLARPLAPAAPTRRFGWPRPDQAADPATVALHADMDAWLTGIDFVRDRLLAVLAAEGITAIPARGQPFDPHLHVALEVTASGPEAPPGVVTTVIRQGYLAGDRVLRHAEVAVAKDTTDQGASS